MLSSELLLVLEIVATVLGILSVYLLTVGRGVGWPVGGVMIVLTGLVYTGRKLYGSASLQLFFLLLQLIGWRRWAKSEEKDLRKASRRLGPRTYLPITLLAAALWYLLSLLLRHHGGAAPEIDSFVTTGSILAQVLMVYCYRECWLVWMVVDVVYVVLSVQQGLWAFGILYLIFTVLAYRGWTEWTRDLEG